MFKRDINMKQHVEKTERTILHLLKETFGLVV